MKALRHYAGLQCKQGMLSGASQHCCCDSQSGRGDGTKGPMVQMDVLHLGLG
jgi:hypothetical protein